MKQIYLSKPQLLFLALLVESVLLFLLAPGEYSFGFNLFCMSQFLISSIAYIVMLKKKNYFDFDLIFLLVYFFIMFFFPVFMYGTDLEKIFFAFQYDYNHDVISRATALSLLGAQAYMYGSVMVSSDRIKPKLNVKQKIVPNGILTIEAIGCFMLFLLAAGPDLFTTTYDGSIGGENASAALTYIMVLFGVILCSAFVIEFNNWSIDRHYKKNWWLFLVYVGYAGIMFVVGSRTLPVQYGLLIVGLFGLKVRPIKFRMMVLMVIFGVVGMGVISLTRSTNIEATEQLKEQAGALIYLQDLVLNNRNTYMAIDMVDRDGIDWGVGMTTSALGAIPFANSMVINSTPLTELDMSSGLRITAESLGTTKDFYVGFGTNIIASIYMSFGMVGVVMLMFLLGYAIRFAMLKALRQNNIYYLLFNGIMVSYSVFIVRADYFTFLRDFLWGLVVINIASLYPYSLNFRLKSDSDVKR